MASYRFGPFRLDKEQLLLSVDTQPLPLGPKVVETLLGLVERPGELVTKNELLDRVWPDGFVEEANLAQNIYVIRKTLRAHWEHDVIETLPRRGYRFVAPLAAEVAAVPVPARTPAVRMQRRFLPMAAVACLLAVIAGVATFDIAKSQARHEAALSPEGARLYAMGQYYWNQRTASAIAKSERYFQQVIATDPKISKGYAGLASAYAIAADYGYGSSSPKLELTKAAALAREALARDPESAQANAVLGLVAVDRERMQEAFVFYRRALTLDPSYAPAHQWYGAALLRSGKAVDGYKELQRAANLDPSSVAATDWLAQAAYVSRRYEDAVSYGRQALDLSPQRYSVYQIIGLSYEALGNDRAAVAAYRAYGSSCSMCRYDAAALLAHAYAAEHESGAAQAALATARRGLRVHAVGYDNLMVALLALGHRTEALDILHHGLFSEPAALLAIDPRMDPVRGDAAFRRYTQSPG
ncbi:MAG TPA: winged helix-turn-helix domain-containing protein [Candidatus Baltobacteraceae bacterium]|nr:winged helix-turn-helix domain-containing protein [Candidatus Baltobacteraceae bacterium]